MDIMATGRIGPVNDESWVGVELGEDGETDESGAAVDDRPVFRTEKIKAVLLWPYRYVLAHLNSRPIITHLTLLTSPAVLG
jgi:hypothetical protein